jgi:hypothetical protein
MVGFIQLHRKLLEWEWYHDVNTFKLFIHLLLKANFEPKKWQGVEIKRGQLVTSIKHLANETGLTDKQVRIALDKLILTKEVGKQTTSQNTTLTILSYDLYQQEGKPKANKKTIEGQTEGERGANEGQQLNKDNKDNKENKDNNSKTFIPPALSDVQDYFKDNGYTTESASKAFNYYASANWVDSKGNKVKNWKQKMQGVWFKPENEIKNNLPTQEQDYNDKMGIRISANGTKITLNHGCPWINHFKFPLRPRPTVRPEDSMIVFERELMSHKIKLTKEEIEEIYKLPSI